jgi:hypothetical protein
LDYFEDISARRKLSPAVMAAALSACATETLLLNSERIERRFGSYGVDVLASEAGLRRSSLYSTENGQRTCRTYSIVRFTDHPDDSYGHEHTKVLAGNSLGQVFRSHGWSIHKQTLHIGALEIDGSESDVCQLMRLHDARTLALHVYQLLLVKNTRVFEYAAIIEAHHPDHLSPSDLLAIYHYDDTASLSAEALFKLTALLRSSSNA